MELRVLRYFLAVAAEQNISRAAESLHITQPTLSRQLADLEDEIGKKLFFDRRRDYAPSARSRSYFSRRQDSR